MTTLTREEVEQNYEKFKEILSTNVKRDGIDTLINWLDSTDLKVAPASSKYHLNCEGGLVKHSLNVYTRLCALAQAEGIEADESIAITGLLHDVSKINYYNLQKRNVKNEAGVWEEVPFYAIKDISSRVVYGSHALNSVYILHKFIPLSYEEEIAILHHMGGKDYGDDAGSLKNTHEVFNKSALAVLLHIADLCSTFIDESI